MEIVWAFIDGYNRQYSISDRGQIVNKHGRYLKQKKTKDGYRTIGLTLDKKQTWHYVHRLVLMTFQPNDSSLTVDHIDGNPANNKLENLRWLSRRENSKLGASKKRKKVRFLSSKELSVYDPKTNKTQLFRLVE